MQQITVIIDRSFGLSGRSRSVKDRREGSGSYFHAHVVMTRTRTNIVYINDSNILATHLTSQGKSSTMRHNELGLGVEQHVLKPFHRIGRIQRDVDLACLERGDNSNEHGGPMFHQNRDRQVAFAAPVQDRVS
jgi:hypothetical protein